jgi:hypothetical protein
MAAAIAPPWGAAGHHPNVRCFRLAIASSLRLAPFRAQKRRRKLFSAAAISKYFADRNGLIPPDHGGLLRIGETLTYA